MAANAGLAAEPSPRPLLRRPIPVAEPYPARRLMPDPTPTAQPELHLPARVLPAPVVRATEPTRHGPELWNGVDPAAWARQFIQAAVEVIDGRRPLGQLLRWATEPVLERLAQRARLTAKTALTRAADGRAGATRAPGVRAVRLCEPRAGVCEVAAVVADGERVRAVAARMESIDQRWVVTALEIG